MDIRQYLRILASHKGLIFLTAVVVALAAGAFATIQTPVYTATSQVLLRPADPLEQLGTADVQQPSDLARYVAGEAAIVQSIPVAQTAALALAPAAGGAKETARHLLDQIKVDQSATSNVLGITAHDHKALRARDIANAFAQAYISNRKSFDVGRLTSAVDALQSKLTSLQANINLLTAQRASNPQSASSLQAALDADTAQYANLLSQQQSLQVDIDLKHGQAEIVSPAVSPAGPSSPRRKRDLAVGLFAGLLLGIALALVREQMDNRIRSVEDAEESTGLVMLGQIPFDRASQSSEKHLVMRDQSAGATAEAIRALRTAVEVRHSNGHVPVIVITSPGPGAGKTMVAANLAASFAEAGRRTLLVSADLRSPNVEGLFGLPRRGPGLGDYVRRGQVSVASVCVETDVRRLFVLKAGAAVSNPAGVFTSKSFDALLAHAAQQIDMIVFDTPPVLAVTDATVITSRADEVLLVVAEDETSRDDARRARSILEAGGNGVAISLVVNKVPVSSSRFDSYYRPVVR